MTTSNRRRSKENAQVGDGDHATDEVRNNDVASELRSPQAGSPQGGRNPPKETEKAQNTKRNNKNPKQLTHMDDARSGPKKNGPNNLERTGRHAELRNWNGAQASGGHGLVGRYRVTYDGFCIFLFSCAIILFPRE